MNIDEKNISTETIVINNCNLIEVEVGTNCPMGGDKGHGGITYLRIQDVAATYMEIHKLHEDKGDGFELKLYGDSECKTLIEALEFAASKLKEQLNINAQNREQ